MNGRKDNKKRKKKLFLSSPWTQMELIQQKLDVNIFTTSILYLTTFFFSLSLLSIWFTSTFSLFDES
ncbi:hypothetical protein BDV25DRAFT_158976 [Aspergillus avenaceus]|uniref:Transmembrane protein n=1 Tax=Aspergillus avenaceus TaxID=36643 RepID=A0A5N6TP55_ASPAV|nr:hypothetical protein BDV25DRAFT_158976 [Aspergillus avenaceus]